MAFPKKTRGASGQQTAGELRIPGDEHPCQFLDATGVELQEKIHTEVDRGFTLGEHIRSFQRVGKGHAGDEVAAIRANSLVGRLAAPLSSMSCPRAPEGCNSQTCLS